MIQKRVFLGGTCNGDPWRDKLIPSLKIDFFNPVVEDWTPECQAEELAQRQSCDLVLYVITPAMSGVYSIAEAVDDSNKRPLKTVFHVRNESGFDAGQRMSLAAVEKMIAENGARVAVSWEHLISILNEGT